MDDGRVQLVQAVESSCHVVQQMPRLFLVELPDLAEDAPASAERQHEIGLAVARVVIERLEQVLVVGVDHQRELAGKHVEAGIVESCSRGIYFQGYFDVGLAVFGKPHFREIAPSE